MLELPEQVGGVVIGVVLFTAFFVTVMAVFVWFGCAAEDR